MGGAGRHAAHGRTSCRCVKKDGVYEGARRVRSSGPHFLGDFLVADDKKISRINHVVACETLLIIISELSEKDYSEANRSNSSTFIG